jgi:hypothetical protein
MEHIQKWLLDRGYAARFNNGTWKHKGSEMGEIKKPQPRAKKLRHNETFVTIPKY